MIYGDFDGVHAVKKLVECSIIFESVSLNSLQSRDFDRIVALFSQDLFHTFKFASKRLLPGK